MIGSRPITEEEGSTEEGALARARPEQPFFGSERSGRLRPGTRGRPLFHGAIAALKDGLS
jgi:hypothetical protein